MEPALIPWSIPLAFAISVFVVGVIFGVYPAARAASLDPIEALRHDYPVNGRAFALEYDICKISKKTRGQQWKNVFAYS